MSKAIIASTVAAFAVGCGPEIGDEDDLPGVLVFEHTDAKIYRLERRIDVIPADSDIGRRECGFLTDRAYDDLKTTIDALDPSVEYVVESEVCQPTGNPSGRVYLDDFEHSPFACDWRCCHPELIRVATVYFVVENNFVDLEPVIDDEPYVAIEPDRPCP
jgi:hypothetical protein